MGLGREAKQEPNQEVLNDLVVSTMLRSTTSGGEGT